MLKHARILTLALLMSAASTPMALAQTEGRLALGALVTMRNPSDSDAHGKPHRWLSKKIGVKVDAGYMIARPKISILSTLGEDARRFRADNFAVRAGLVYSIF